MTALSVMQCVDRGQLKLDDDVTAILPELKDLDILEGFEEESGKPILKKATKKITLRYVLPSLLMRYKRRKTPTTADECLPTHPAWVMICSNPCS